MRTQRSREGSNTPPPLAGGGGGEGAAPTALLSHAKALRRDATPAEKRLWQVLRKHQAHGLKFRRQVPLGPYIADFYCAAAKLVVELDGVSHIDAPDDAVRDAWMQRHGLRVVRIPNGEVLRNLEGVVAAIVEIAVAPPPPSPLPRGEGESGDTATFHPFFSHV